MNLLVTGARAPIAADLAKAFALSGHRVWLTDSLRAPVSAASPFVQGYLRMPPPRADFQAFTASLINACNAKSIDAIIPTSEEVFWLAGAAPFLPPNVNLRTSALPLLSRLHHKGTFATLAASLGLGAPEAIEMTSLSDLAGLREPKRFVLKPCYSRFASRVLIIPTSRDLERVRPTTAQPWLAQTRVKGRELCAYNVATDGRLLFHVAYEPLIRFGVGASVYFSPVVSSALRAMSERFIATTGFTGQISFDAIETERGLVALECNPRGTSGVHLASQQPDSFSAALLGTLQEPLASVAPEPRMLLFPLLLTHFGTLATARGRQRVLDAKDALTAAGIPLRSQLSALAEMVWRSARSGLSPVKASTVDIEWNGEPMLYGQ